jgi:hypothetical protein
MLELHVAFSDGEELLSLPVAFSGKSDFENPQLSKTAFLTNAACFM